MSTMVYPAFRCRCGAPITYSAKDPMTGKPEDGCDYWCSDNDPQKGPHDWGIVNYEVKLHQAPRPEP